MLELSLSLSLRARTCATTDCVLGHTFRGAVIASPDMDVNEEPWADCTSFLLAGPTAGPPDGLRGRMLYKFREDDMATGSPCWNTVQREVAALLFQTVVGASHDTNSAWIAHRLLVLNGLRWKTRQVSRPGMPPSLSLTTSPHVDCGCWSLAEASLPLLHRQGWRLTLQRRMCAPCQYALTLPCGRDVPGRGHSRFGPRPWLCRRLVHRKTCSLEARLGFVVARTH